MCRHALACQVLTRRDQLKGKRVRKEKDGRSCKGSRKENKTKNKRKSHQSHKSRKNRKSRKLRLLRSKSSSDSEPAQDDSAKAPKKVKKATKGKKATETKPKKAAAAEAKQTEAKTDKTENSKRTKTTKRQAKADVPYDESTVLDMITWMESFLEEPTDCLDELKTQVRAHLPDLNTTRLDIYWSRGSCGIRMNTCKKNCGYLSLHDWLQGGHPCGNILMSVKASSCVAPQLKH